MSFRSPSPASVLVVDDEQDIRELLGVLLDRAGHEVRLACDGREGLRALHAHPPDLVVLDITMPGLDGWQTHSSARRARRSRKPAPAFVAAAANTHRPAARTDASAA